MTKLCIIMIGLPARGKSLMAERLREGLSADGLQACVFNNGNLRRATLGYMSGAASFYHPDNEEGRMLREKIAADNMRLAREFLQGDGQVAILDATNGSRSRRAFLEQEMVGFPILYVECVNDDPELLALSVKRKARLPEFGGLTRGEAVRSFKQRIEYYERIMVPLSRDNEKSYVRVGTLDNRILEEHGCDGVPFYIQIRDILVSDWIRNMFLVRHSQSVYNVEGRIGGDSPLTPQGVRQAEALARHFKSSNIPYIFTSTRLRSGMTAGPLLENHPDSQVIALQELDEINAGICDGMTYEEIREKMPEEYAARARNKYDYIYPGGEGYVTLKYRVAMGFRKALFLSGAAPGMLVIGHQAINRMILSLFMYRPNDAVPYIYVPQDEYFHVVATHRKKLLELVRFTEQAAG